jgi:RHS repeat-associated protein
VLLRGRPRCRLPATLSRTCSTALASGVQALLPASPLAQALATSDGAAYVHGLDLVAERRSGAWAYPLGDALGSVRQWTDEDGYVNYAGGYTPFGTQLWTEGSTSSSWGYTGEWWDSRAGLLYLRARWYDRSTGRFTQVDPVGLDYQQPQSINRYPYVLGNPIRYTDPTGYCAWYDAPCNALADQIEAEYQVEIVRFPSSCWSPVLPGAPYSWTTDKVQSLGDTLELMRRFMEISQFNSHIRGTRYSHFLILNSGRRASAETFPGQRVEFPSSMQAGADFVRVATHESYHVYAEQENLNRWHPTDILYGAQDFRELEREYGLFVGWTCEGTLCWPDTPPADLYWDYLRRGPHEDWAESATRFTLLWMAGRLEGSGGTDRVAVEAARPYSVQDLGFRRNLFMRAHFRKGCGVRLDWGIIPVVEDYQLCAIADCQP